MGKESLTWIIFIILTIFLVIDVGLILFDKEFTTSNSNTLTLFFNFFIALSTSTYVVVTWFLVLETKKLREFQTQPTIAIYVKPRDEWLNFFDMVIKNIGSAPAYNIKFEVEPDFEYSKGVYLSQMSMMQGINYLAPNEKIQNFLTNLTENHERKMKEKFQIKVNYKDKNKKIYSENFVINFLEFSSLVQIGEPPIYEISKSLKEIRKDIGKIARILK